MQVMQRSTVRQKRVENTSTTRGESNVSAVESETFKKFRLEKKKIRAKKRRADGPIPNFAKEFF
jgi:hypothetical protein